MWSARFTLRAYVDGGDRELDYPRLGSQSAPVATLLLVIARHAPRLLYLEQKR
jgi:hypothetical protein